jgi:Zn-finger nucleic acid-binding protein
MPSKPETVLTGPCPLCGARHTPEDIDGALKTCPSCGGHYRGTGGADRVPRRSGELCGIFGEPEFPEPH